MSQGQSAGLAYDDGAGAVELAREAVTAYVVNGQREQTGSMREAFYTRCGVLVRLEAAGGRLRGCAGDPYSTAHLGQGIVDAAIGASSEESCGSELDAAELEGIRVTVCVLDGPKATTDPTALSVGEDVAVIRTADGPAWVFPTVAAKHNWSPAEYLDRTCRTGGLPQTAWESDDVDIDLFSAAVFRERVAAGEIEQVTPAG